MNEINQSRTPHGLDCRAARVVPAPPADVFRALTDPQQMSAWWGKTAKTKLTSCDMDVRHDGSFRLAIQAAAGPEVVVSGVYTEVDPPYRLAFTWTSANYADAVADSRVMIELLDLKDGTTRAVVTQQDLPAPSVVHVYSAGWHDMLQDLSLHFVGA